MATITKLGVLHSQELLPGSLAISSQVVFPPREWSALKDNKRAVEHFGILRSRVLNARGKQGICAILISSSLRGEGKSFTAANLAASVAELKQDRVLLIDGDLRMRAITKLTGLQQASGLAEYLEHRSAFEDCIQSTTLPGLSIAPAGLSVSPHVATLLEGAGLPEFIRRAKQGFDLILVDSVPASAPIADFELLLAACDKVLLVTRLNGTTRSALQISTQKVGSKLLGIVVNNASARSSSEYYKQDDRSK